jgi:N-carbamoylputrescine amidase
LSELKSLTVGLVQRRCTENRQENFQKAAEGVAAAASRGAELVVLQELHATPYFCQAEKVQAFDLADPVPGLTTEFFADVARSAGVVLVLSVFERRAPGLYHNTAVVLERDGSIAGKYRKMHIPDDPGFCEKFYFTPGDLGFEPVTTSVGRLGVLVCWDQWYPEAARLMALAGADLLIYPTAIGWDPKDPDEEKARQLEAWLTIQRSHAVANGLPVVSVNRVGWEPRALGSDEGIQFWGSSFVAGCQGELLARGGEEEEVLVVEIDRSRTENVRRIWPFLRDRRIDAYGDLLKRFRD